jgi:nicotinamide phosphoribosyltransferase
MIADWLKIFDKGILSIVSDTFDLWKLITEYLPANKEAIMARDGKLVIRPDSGNPVDIVCGRNYEEIDDVNNLYFADSPEVVFCKKSNKFYETNPYDDGHKTRFNLKEIPAPAIKGVIELLWDIFGGTINAQGYKVLDPHIGAIYGDSITLERQLQIYERLEAKGFASTNIVLGVGSFTYQYNTRDTLGFAAKGAWFQAEGHDYDIYKDPVTDDGTKKSLKGRVAVFMNEGKCHVETQCTPEQEATGLLQTIYENGQFFNQITLTTIREKIKNL